MFQEVVLVKVVSVRGNEVRTFPGVKTEIQALNLLNEIIPSQAPWKLHAVSKFKSGTKLFVFDNHDGSCSVEVYSSDAGNISITEGGWVVQSCDNVIWKPEWSFKLNRIPSDIIEKGITGSDLLVKRPEQLGLSK